MLIKTSFCITYAYALKAAANKSGKIEINNTLENFYLFSYFIIIKDTIDKL
jgi:hypothetical protein